MSSRLRHDVLMRVLVVNAGSSSLKLALLDTDDTVIGHAHIENWNGTASLEVLREFIATHGPANAVGHRIVHGGSVFVGPVIADQPTQRAIESLSALAPLHQARGIAGIIAAREVLPDAIQVACFDTAFHAALPLEAATYPLPAEWREQWPIRRYGFHGLSHAHVVRRAPRLLGRSVAGLRIVSCHLGSGASLCATRDGHSLDTTMGFTPLDGLVMATRSGSIDPGLVLWLIGHLGGTLDEVNRSLEERSGLVGLAGGTGDMREIIERRSRGDTAAALAFDVYLHRLAAEIAAMTSAIGGLDVLVFTAGVGEHSPEVRAALESRLAFLGICIDPGRNAANGPDDRDISAPGAGIRTLIIRSREDLEIARQTRSVVHAHRSNRGSHTDR
jgi:acetate kinase